MDENKYFETLKQYDLDLDDEKVKRQVENLLREALFEMPSSNEKEFHLTLEYAKEHFEENASLVG